MKREAKILLDRGVSSLIVSIDSFNRPWDTGRVEGFLIMLDHSFEMLLKASIVHKNGSIKERNRKYTLGFDACIRKALSDPDIKFLEEEQALTLQATNNLRDAAQHYYLEISEEHLYLQCSKWSNAFQGLVTNCIWPQLGRKFTGQSATHSDKAAYRPHHLVYK